MEGWGVHAEVSEWARDKVSAVLTADVQVSMLEWRCLLRHGVSHYIVFSLSKEVKEWIGTSKILASVWPRGWGESPFQNEQCSLHFLKQWRNLRLFTTQHFYTEEAPENGKGWVPCLIFRASQGAMEKRLFGINLLYHEDSDEGAAVPGFWYLITKRLQW